jgi:hypothetical protein
MNHLYYGDNLDVLRRHIEDESVDLVYLDPPFNSSASYNVLFAERDGTQAAAQIKAFEDTWRWDESAARAYEEVVEGGGTVSSAMQAFRTLLGDTDMFAYLAMMTPRLVELRRVLKPTVSLPDAVKLAHDDPYQFQWWALGLVGARPVEQKKGADKGIDGRIYFHDEGAGSKTKQIIFSVKAGHLSPAHLRDLRGVLDRELAEIGVLLCMEEPTGPMRKEAASAGFYTSPWGKHPKLQILTIEDLLTGKTLDRPPAQTSVTFKRAPKAEAPAMKGRPLDFEAVEHAPTDAEED